MKKKPDPLSRKVLLHICKDGTITYRTRDQKVFNKVALPFFSVNTEGEARQLQILLCKQQYKSHPDMPKEPWFVFAGFGGEVDDIEDVTKLFTRVHTMVKRRRK